MAASIAPVDLVRREQHVGAGVAVEHELALAVAAQRDEGQRRAGLRREAQRADVDALAGQRVGQEMAERVVADLAHEGAADAQPGQAHGDVGGGPARRLLEAGASARPVPVTVGTKSISRSPKQTRRPCWPHPVIG